MNEHEDCNSINCYSIPIVQYHLPPACYFKPTSSHFSAQASARSNCWPLTWACLPVHTIFSPFPALSQTTIKSIVPFLLFLLKFSLSSFKKTVKERKWASSEMRSSCWNCTICFWSDIRKLLYHSDAYLKKLGQVNRLISSI